MVKQTAVDYERNGVEGFDCGGVGGSGERNGVDQFAFEEVVCGLWACGKATVGRRQSGIRIENAMGKEWRKDYDRHSKSSFSISRISISCTSCYDQIGHSISTC